MSGANNIIPIQKSELLAKTKECFDKGYRAACITCVREPSSKEACQKFEMSYSFEINNEYTTYRVELAPAEELPSITSVYGSMYLYENEIHDLYGIKITGINLDFKGTFYKVAIPTPFNPACGTPAQG